MVGGSKWNGDKGGWFGGQIADVQVYPRALPASEVSTWTLDQRGLPTSMTDPDGNVTSYANDEAGHGAVVTAPAISTESNGGTPVTARPVTATGYDTFGDQAEVQDPNGNTTTYGYDGDGHVTTQMLPPYTPPGGPASITAPTVSVYDGDGNLTQATDPLVIRRIGWVWWCGCGRWGASIA